MWRSLFRAWPGFVSVFNSKKPKEGPSPLSIPERERFFMKNRVLTKDIYFCKALSVIAEQLPRSEPLCFIDIESFTSLGSICECLQRGGIHEGYRLMFIGGKGVCSRVLEPLVSVYRQCSLSAFKTQITTGRTYSPRYALRHMTHCRSLDMLTWAQKKVLFTLKETVDVNAAANIMCLSPKTLYTYSRQIGEKLNLNSLFQVRLFFFAEFAQERSASPPNIPHRRVEHRAGKRHKKREPSGSRKYSDKNAITCSR